MPSSIPESPSDAVTFTFIVLDADAPSTATGSRFNVGSVLSIWNGFVVPIIFEFPASSSTYIHKYQSSPVASAGLVISCPGVNGVPFVLNESASGAVGLCVHWYFNVSSFIPASFAPSVGLTVTVYDCSHESVFPSGLNETCGGLLSILNGPMSSFVTFPSSSSAYIHKCQLFPVSPAGVFISSPLVNVVPFFNVSSDGVSSPFTHTYFGMSSASPEFGSSTSTFMLCSCFGVV